MGLITDPTAELLERVLAYRDVRHAAIASNVANANTPGYRAFDLVLREALGEPAPLVARRSDPRHLSPAGQLEGSGARVEQSRAPARLDGNNVSLEKELMKLLENRVMYQASVELMDRWKNLGVVARTMR